VSDAIVQAIVGPVPPQAWGGRYLLDNNPGGRTPKKSVFVYTPPFKEPRFFWVQMRFALDGGRFAGGTPGQPELPFSETMVNDGTSIGQVTVSVKRSVSAQGGTMDDSYVVDGAPSVAGETSWFPVMVLPGKQLVIDIENTGEVAIWVDCSCAPLTTLTQEQLMALRWSTGSTGGQGINARPNVFGFGDVPGTIGNGPKRTPASATPQLLLPADPTRRQFWVSNESTDRLALRFSNHDPDVTAASESWDVILDAKGPGNFSRYQSPVDAYWGEVRGVWEGTNGFALASGAIYFLQPNSEAL
jgi:hypothetical protein